MGLDTRIGPKFLQPGPGYGGSCFPKDTKAFVRMGESFGTPQRIVAAVVKSNARRKRNLVHRVRRACGGNLAGKRIAVLGLAFKTVTDDVRESPAPDLLPALGCGGGAVGGPGLHAMQVAEAGIDGSA